MKHFATLVAAAVLMLNLGVEAAYARDESVKMTFSGTSENTAINLQQPNTSNDEDTFAGKGTPGSFTLLNVRAIANSPRPSSACSGPNLLYLEELAGAGVFRFEDGSLLNVTLTQGADCIDLAANVAHCTLTFKIASGTGRFKEASGVLTMTETVSAVASDALGNPVLFAATGEFTGTVSGVDLNDNQDAQK